MNKKEQTPLAVHKAIEPYLDKEDGLFIKIPSKDDLIRFRGSSPDSIFYFHIKSHRKGNNRKNEINISYQPYSEESVDQRSVWVECNGINGHFQLWLRVLNGYSSTKTVFDDPIVKGFEENYYSYFEIIDEEKEKPLDPISILPLYEHFEKIKLKLNEYKDESNNDEIEEIQGEIEQLNNSLTVSGRQEIAHRICNIWAKLTKLGVNYIKEFVVVSRKYVMKEAAQRIFQLGQKGFEYIDDLDKLLN